MSNFLCFQQSRSCPSPNSRTNKPVKSIKHHRLDKKGHGWSWLDSWMAVKPWDSRLFEEMHSDPSEMTPFYRKSEDNIVGFYSCSSEQDSVKVRRNNVNTKIIAKPPITTQITRSSSPPSSESLYEGTSPSTSSSSTSVTPISGNTLMMERAEESYYRKPSYMNLTRSIKAKQKASRFCSPKKWMELSNGDDRSLADSEPSFNLCKDLYPPIPLGPTWSAEVSTTLRFLEFNSLLHIANYIEIFIIGLILDPNKYNGILLFEIFILKM